MPLRELSVFLPSSRNDDLDGLIGELELEPIWRGTDDDGTGVMMILTVDAFKVEDIIAALEERFRGTEHFRIVLIEATAILPRPEEPESEEAVEKISGVVEGDEGEAPEEEEKPSPSRILIEELLENLREGSTLSNRYLAMVILSALVAAVGLIRDNTAVVIGAMVIAPLLGPNMALALGTTLGKWDIIKSCVATNAAGISVAFAFALGAGFLLPVDPSVAEIASRTSLGYGDLVLAGAAGAAGALAFTSGVSASLVGVMVAVALMPPLVASGLLFGAGQWTLGVSAALLTAANVIMINLAGVVTFMIQKVRPRNFWEAGIAGRMMARALVIWVALLALLVVIIAVS